MSKKNKYKQKINWKRELSLSGMPDRNCVDRIYSGIFDLDIGSKFIDFCGNIYRFHF